MKQAARKALFFNLKDINLLSMVYKALYPRRQHSS
jgi:hypothetical protein